jgi:hypothetical protein
MTRKRLVLAGAALAAVVSLAVAAAFGAFAAGGSASAARAGADGVKVHGQWTVVVRSKSGQVVRRYHFHNDFVTTLGTSGGSHAFAKILSGAAAPGDWDLSISGDACPASNANFCQMFEPDASPSFFNADADTKNLTVTEPTSGTDAFKIVLQGTVPAANDGSITRVSTGLQVCGAGSAVGSDCSIGYNEITDRTLSSPIAVSAGQTMSVTVKLSFS